MTEPKTKCTSCGCQIQQMTADRNGGRWACHRKATAPPPDPPVPSLTRTRLDELIASRSCDEVVDALFQPACDKVNFRPAEMTDGDIIVYTVWTFLGEVENGGVIQYLTNQSGGWAHHCGPSLRKIGADKYAEVIEQCISAFTDSPLPDDPQWESDLDEFCDDNDEAFEELEEKFWNIVKRTKKNSRISFFNSFENTLTCLPDELAPE